MITHIGDIVQRYEPANPHAEERIGLDVVTADVRDQVHLRAEKGTVSFSGQLKADLRRVARVVVHVLFASQRQLHWTARLKGQCHADRDRWVHLDARPESAADGHALDVDLAQRDAKDLA